MGQHGHFSGHLPYENCHEAAPAVLFSFLPDPPQDFQSSTSALQSKSPPQAQDLEPCGHTKDCPDWAYVGGLSTPCNTKVQKVRHKGGKGPEPEQPELSTS